MPPEILGRDSMKIDVHFRRDVASFVLKRSREPMTRLVLDSDAV